MVPPTAVDRRSLTCFWPFRSGLWLNALNEMQLDLPKAISSESFPNRAFALLQSFAATLFRVFSIQKLASIH
jgi:hypothetical protein